MSQTRTHGTRMPCKRKKHLGKLETPVDSGVSAGLQKYEMAPFISPTPSSSDTMPSSTKHDPHDLIQLTSNIIENPDISKTSGTLEYLDKNTQNTQTTQNTPRRQTPKVTLGYLGINDRPEEARPPVVYGKINGRTARIMLDCGCSTYVLSTDFVNGSNIPCYSCKPIPVELAVRNTGQFTLDTQTKKLPMEIGTITQS